jgi:hypothetical protein
MADPTKRMGAIEPYRTADGKLRFRSRMRLSDGSRKSVDVPEKYSYSEDRAREFVAAAQEREDQAGALLADKVKRAARRAGTSADGEREAGETCNAWFARYNAYQRELRQTDFDKKRDRWNKWIAPIIGSKPIALVTRDDVEDVRDALDRAIAEWSRTEGKNTGKKGTAISGKTAMNVWSALTSSFKAATSSKRRDLRILDGKPNPCVGVEPPRRSRLSQGAPQDLLLSEGSCRAARVPRRPARLARGLRRGAVPLPPSGRAARADRRRRRPRRDAREHHESVRLHRREGQAAQDTQRRAHRTNSRRARAAASSHDQGRRAHRVDRAAPHRVR